MLFTIIAKEIELFAFIEFAIVLTDELDLEDWIMMDVRTEKEEMIFSYYAERMMFCLIDSRDSSAALQVSLSI